MSIRTERVAGEIQQALANLFQADFADVTDGLITVTKVRMSADLGSARVYVSLLGGSLPPQKTLDTLKKEVPHIRAAVARRVRLKFVPDLNFYLDDTQEEVAHLEDIFNLIRAENTARAPLTEPSQEPLSDTEH